MIDRDQIVSDDELHAYVDGELPLERRSTVEAWLATHADDAARVEAWRGQRELIRARYGSVAGEPLPPQLHLRRLLLRRRSGMAAAVAAAVIAAFFGGGVAGWFAHGAAASAPSDFTRFTRDALAAYRL